MNDTITITIPGKPISAMRHRDSRWGGKYNPQHRIAIAYRRTLSHWQTLLPAGWLDERCWFMVSWDSYYKPPRSWGVRKRRWALWCSWYGEKPDRDNLDKWILDCGTGILWPDDKQVVGGTITKRYGEVEQTVITIRKLKPPELSAQGQDILSHFTPSELAEIGRHLDTLREYGFMEDQSSVTGLELERCAIALSALADRFAKPLTQVAKKHGGFWKGDKPPPFEERDEPVTQVPS